VALILPENWRAWPWASRIKDSKKLNAKARQDLYHKLTAECRFGVGQASVAEVDSMNVLQATMTAMRRAYDDLGVAVECALVDGNRVPDLPCPARAIVGGDGKEPAIAAASIVAKVLRDGIMADLAKDHPFYGWDRNAGYGTVCHQEGLGRHGVTPHHRQSFKPIQRYLVSAAQSTRIAA
jgi:ribonuclease HII